MGEFSWAYISGGAGDGPNGSVQVRNNSALSGTRNFTYDFSTDLLSLTGSMEISGTLTANQYNINVIDKSVINLSASGDTKFGDTSDDTHQFTGSVFVTGTLSGSFVYGDGSNLVNLPAGNPAGADTQIQFNDGGSFGASANLAWDDTNFQVVGNISGSGTGQFGGALTGTHIVPNADEQYDIGQESLRFENAYFNFMNGGVSFTAVNDEGATITKGQVVYIKGVSGGTPTVALAACDEAAKMPAFGFVADGSITQGSQGRIVTMGRLNGINTSAFSEGDILYVQTGSSGVSGSVTATRPTGSGNLLQNVAKVTEAAASGQIRVGGAGRTNATPNLDKGFLFVGNDSDQSVQDNTIFISSSQNRVGINTVTPKTTLDVSGSMMLTGTLNITGSGQSLLVLDTRDADSLKEIVFQKDGAAAAAIQINSNEHMFVENENAKDIILRTNNQNTVRVFGANQRVGIAKTGVSANAILDVNGSTTISGSFTVSGSSTIGLGTNHQSTFGGGLTASLGVTLGENSFVASNKNIVFGSGGNSVIQYNSGLNKLIISGSLGAGGIDLQGGEVTIDFPGGTIASGALGGPGSYIGLDSNHRLILTGSGEVSAAGGNTQVQFNNNGDLGASANFTFDTADSELEVKGNLQVVSGSTPVFEIDSGLTPGASGSVRGRMVQTIVSQFDLTNGSFASVGRYVDLHGASGVSNTLDRQNALLTPFSGRLISITYHFPGATQNSANGTPQWELRVADVNQLKGNTINSAVVATAQCTASSWPGQNYVGGVNVQNGEGTLGGTNTTGSWAFGTGSAVGLRFKSGDGTSANIPGQAIVTTVWEFDQLNPFISGSGN